MDQLKIPNRLYGRDSHTGLLLSSFERIGCGKGEVLLLSGSSGAGKTALVHELQRPVLERNGFFIRGKFDQYQQNIPYFAFQQALAHLCRIFASGGKQRQARLKDEILEAVGKLGQVLVDLAPEFESFLGPQPPLGEISPQEARHRFAGALRNFLQVVCRPEHPLVLFIDDWQWADAASFELLRQLQIGESLRHLLVIVSYRDNEVGAGHPLLSTVDDLRILAVPVNLLYVENISEDDVQRIVADTLKPAAVDIKGLSAVIYSKTEGNPFFVRSFLHFLHEYKLIWFDGTLDSWVWRTVSTGETTLPDNIVELFAHKLRRLDKESQNLFSLAACLGNRFDVDTLSLISGRSTEECLALLFSDKAKGILLPLAGGDASGHPGDRSAPCAGEFRHDRLQQAAYRLIEPAEIPLMLLNIGRLLLINLKPEQLEERLFQVLNHLNAGHDLILETTEQVRMVELNIAAARKAYAATAYSSALEFYRAAARFLEKPRFAEHLWRNFHALTMNLFEGRAACEFLEGDRSEAEKCIRHAAAHAKTALEKAEVLNQLIVQCTLLARYPQAIAVGRQALAALGIALPEEGYEGARSAEIALVRRELEHRPVSSLIDLPAMSDPEMLMAAKILITMGPPCYRSHQMLWGVIVPRVVNLTLRYGNIPQVGYSHTAFGGLIGWVDDDYRTAKEFGELATSLMTDTFRSPSDQSVFHLMIGSSLRHWSRHLSCSSQDYADAFETGLRSGNLQYAAYAFGHNMYCRFYQGAPLPLLMQEAGRSLAFSRSRLNNWAIDLLEGGLHLFGALSSESAANPGDDDWSETEYLQRVADHQNVQVTCIYLVLKTCSLLLLGAYDSALLLSDEAEALIYTVGTQGLLPWPEHLFARLMIIAALYAQASEEQRLKWRSELDQLMGRLRIWSDNCPDNFGHKYLLAGAEMARIDGRPAEAMHLYDEAVEAAWAGNFLQWEGFANERACSFWQESGDGRLAQVYWQQAYICYDRWGAVAKVRSMEGAYRSYLAGTLLPWGETVSPGEGPKGETQKVLVDKQINLLRDHAFQMQQASRRIEAVAEAEELVQSMQRLRVEVAERKRAEDALRASEERFRTMFHEAPLGIALIDSSTGAVHSVNPMFAKIVGRTVAEMSGIDWMGITHPDDVKADLDNIALLNAGKISGFQMEKRYLLPDGAFVWINMTIAPICLDRVPVHHLCMIEDISQRKLAEKELWDKNTELERFTYTVSHDLKSPLVTIQTYAGMIGEDMEVGNHDRARADLQRIEAAASKMTTLLNNLLALSRIGKMTNPLAAVDMNRLVKDTLMQLAGPVHRRQVELLVQSDLPQVQGDRQRIGEVLQNLVENAIKYMGDQGAPRIEIGTRQDAKECVFYIRDNGVGIEKRYQESIFGLFQKLEARSEGTGIGLALVRRIIEVHGGKVWVESEGAGKGSVFCFALPVAKKTDIFAGEPSR